ncbi:hypothetical protein LCGC14_1433650 [marine sediment metagenome]|uniref:Uncharacterized protein n=1 Tax=marine sediment metagenome TaxID=412755 RepID=A0A0F9K925_9ZZZZ
MNDQLGECMFLRCKNQAVMLVGLKIQLGGWAFAPGCLSCALDNIVEADNG